MFLLRVQRVAGSWAQEDLARVLDVYLHTEFHRHRALLSHFMATQVGLLTKERDGVPAIPQLMAVCAMTIFGRTTICQLTTTGLALMAYMPRTEA
jgi:hypothetical protein